VEFKNKMKKFSFTKCGLSRLIWGLAVVAAAGGEMRSNYFQYSAPLRKSQQIGCCLAPLGDQIIWNFPAKI